MAERIDIELTDKINPAIAKKLADIRANAVAANTALAELKKNLVGIDIKGIVSLSKAQADAAKAAQAQALAEQKLAQQVANTAKAQAQAAQATSKAASANNEAAVSTVKLQTAQTQLASSQQRLAGSTNQNAISQQKLATATARTASAQSQAAASAARYASAQQSTQQAILKTASAQQNLIRQTNIAATSAVQLQIKQQGLSQSYIKTQQAATQLAISQQKLQQSTINTTTATIKQQQANVKLQQSQLQLAQQQKAARTGGTSSGVLFGLSAGLLGSEIVDEIANYQNLNNRIRVTTASEAEFTQVRDKLLKVSNETFTSLEANALVYQRLAPIAERYGQTQDQLFTVITNVNKALAVSGSTAEEARGALIQLSQALGGDFKTSAQELNSILEQAPGIAKVFADQLGITTTDLKKFAKAGEISTKDFFKAFEDGGKGIAELQLRFSKLVPSLTQLGQVFQNTFTQAIGQISETTGLTTALSKGIVGLTDHVGILATGIAAIFPILIGGLVTSEIAMAAFNATVFKNPFVIGGAILAGAITAIAQLNDGINGAGDTLRKLNIAAYDFDLEWQHIKISIVDALDSLYGTHNADPLKEIYNSTIDARNALIETTKASEDLYRAEQKLTTLKEAYKKTPTAQLYNDIQDAKGAVNELSKAFEKSDEAISKTHSSTNGLDDAISKAGQAGKSAGNVMAKSFAEVTKEINQASVAFLTLAQETANYSARGGAKIIDVSSALAQQGVGGTVSIGSKPINSMTGEEWTAYAGGGGVRGPGSGTSDSVPAMLSNGEFVVNASAASKYATLLSAINKSPIHMATGGFVGNPVFQNPDQIYTEYGNVKLGTAPPAGPTAPSYTGPTEYLPANYLPSTYMGTGSESLQGGTFSLGGSEYDALIASGLEPYIGMNGNSGGWKFTGNYSSDIQNSFATQAANIQAWENETANWLSTIMPDLQDPQARSDVQAITDAWISGFPMYTIDPRPYIPGPPIGAAVNSDYNKLEYHFEDVTSKFLSAGYAAAILSTSPAWGDTLGNYVQYSGPSYGGTLSYGGDPSDPLSYLISKDDLTSALTSSVGFSSGGNGMAGFGSSDPVASFFDSGNYYGAFRDGGSFIVGGDGGPDSQLVQFLASPEERVDVSRPGERPEERRSDSPTFGSMFGPGSVVIRPTGHPQDWKRSEDQVVGDLTKKVFGRAKQMGLVR